MFRGGGEPEVLFRRIANGIEGTPMPAATALSDDEIWALVAYVKSFSNFPNAVAVENKLPEVKPTTPEGDESNP